MSRFWLALVAVAAMGQDGPWNHRVLLATSGDGLKWAVQPQALAEKASVPELFLSPEGKPTVLFVDASGAVETVGAMQRGPAGWVRVATNLREVDPNVVRLKDGSYRAYVKAGLQGAMAAYASGDGLNWTLVGEVFRDVRYPNATDPDVFETADGWVMLVSLGAKMLRCTSADGLKFETDGTVLELGGSVSDTVQVEGGWRTYFHVNGNLALGTKIKIRSAFTRDGKTWEVEEGDRVVAPETGPAALGVADPAPVRMADGTWLMAIKSFIGTTTAGPGTGIVLEGMQTHRVESATSVDGLTWTRDEGVRLERASVPCVINDRDERVLMYYVRPPDTQGELETVACAVSADGTNFERETSFQIEGLSTRKAVDPSIVRDGEGRFRLYYLASNAAGDPAAGENPHWIHMAVSDDGVKYKETGRVFEYPDLVDPDVFRVGDEWLMYVFAKTGTVRARSSDGTSFRYEGMMEPGGWGTTAPVLLEDGRLRLYAFDQRAQTGNVVRSFVSTDGVKWLAEEGDRLRAAANEQITDPFVIRWRGGWKMYFKTVRAVAGFRTGQSADLVLGAKGFNNSGGAGLLNHPTGLATDGKALAVADRWNNRVLLWRVAPTGNTPPDLVLGQPDFEQNNSGSRMDQMNWPGNVAMTPDGRRVMAADTNNNRVLIWNEFPASSGVAADVVLDLTKLGPAPGPGVMNWAWPWGVWTDGRRMAVVATQGAVVLQWNTIPVRDNVPPDVVVKPEGAGTPRNITSDGEGFFAVSDHNNGEASRPATMVWGKVPEAGDTAPAFRWDEWMKGTFTGDGKLVMAGMQTVRIWNRKPESATAADVVLRPAGYRNGDGPDAVVAGGRLYVSNYNGNNVLGWNAVPERADQQPDFSVGSDRADQDTWAEHFFITNPALAIDGQSLFASSDFDRKIFVWRVRPEASGAAPDAVIRLDDAPWDSAAHGGRLAAAGKTTVYLWSRLPLNGEGPETTYRGRIGEVELKELTGVAMDGRHFYLADRGANCIWVWEGMPSPDRAPRYRLEMPNAGRLSSDGTYLAAAPFEGQQVWVWRVDGLEAGPVKLGGNGQFNLPMEAVVAGGRFVVADRGNNRVQVWNQVAEALAGKAANAYLGAANASDRQAGVSETKLFMPGSLAWDGAHLWVGEFKFSTRILRFSPK